MIDGLLPQLLRRDFRAIARSISLIENQVEGYEEFLTKLPSSIVPIIGITGPPGAGKSTLTDALIKEIVTLGKTVAVLCVDPSSPFNLGALLGDRVRMSEWYTNPAVFIRSLASRGSVGGLHPMILEITELIRAAQFDYIIIETVGVGQSEIEIAGLADKYYQKGKTASLLKMYLSPLVNFIQGYIFKGGFLDGKEGCQIAAAHAAYTFEKYRLLKEKGKINSG